MTNEKRPKKVIPFHNVIHPKTACSCGSHDFQVLHKYGDGSDVKCLECGKIAFLAKSTENPQ